MISGSRLKDILGIIFGIVLIVSNILTFINRTELINKGFETTAIVTELSRNYTARRTIYSVFVEYTIDSISYNNSLNLEFNSTYLGEEITILYNPNNPKNITPKDRTNATDNPVSLVARSVPGVIVILLSVSLGRSNIKRSKRTYKY